jgi:hypothetical protein
MRSRLRSIAIASAGVAALAAAGCGDSSPQRLSHAELVERADAACRTASTDVKALKPPSSLKALAAYSTAVHDIGTALEARLEKLDPPAADAARLAAYRAGLHRATVLVADLGAAAARSDAGSVRRAADRVADVDVGVLAARAGLSTCATAVILPTS